MSEETTCRRSESGGDRVIVDRHTRECSDEGCRGCEPCAARHCILCKKKHSLDQTCPSCLHAVRENIDAITDCLRLLGEQALAGSVLTGSGAVRPEAASEIPGGEAAVEIGPWSFGDAAVDKKQIKDEHARPDATISLTLATWSREWTTAAAGTHRHPLIPDHVTWASKHARNFATFDLDMRKARSRLEDLVHAGERSTLGAPCSGCHRPLERQWGEHAADDRWWCDRCKRSLGVGEYVSTVGKNYRANAEWLTSADLVAVYRIPRGTLSGWASAGHVRKKRDLNTGRVVYNVHDATARRDQTA